MKRRNVDCGKLRRPIKRSKIAEGIYGSTFVYIKFLMVWALVLIADFILDFRFEYLWPFWLMVRSVYDSFKYQGVAFSMFFVCIAITSDVVCYLFIPVQWLFFAASTYVWVQYVWHTERGICLPTVSLWLLFVYIEASVRLRDLKNLPFHLDLCRPFAAHCIGYPVVTLGFGFKSYVSYRLRVRKQKEVQKENDFYMQLLQNSLPPELQSNTISAEAAKKSIKSTEEVISNGISENKKAPPGANTDNNKKQIYEEELDDYLEQTPPRKANVNDYDETTDNTVNETTVAKAYRTINNKVKMNSARENGGVSGKKAKTNNSKTDNTATNNVSTDKDILLARLENDIKRLKTDLQQNRNTEQDLRSQILSLSMGDKALKSDRDKLQQDNETLQTKLHNLVTSRQQDKQNLSILERKLQEERKCKAIIESQLANERKAKKAEEAAAARAVVMAAAARVECTEHCKSHKKDLENDVMQLRRDIMMREDTIRQLEREAQSLRQYKEAQSEADVLMSALSAMQDKNNHLESSLSAETRIKMDLFSALGDAKRQIEIQQEQLAFKEKECHMLKSKIAEVMALVPTSTYNGVSSDTTSMFLLDSKHKQSSAMNHVATSAMNYVANSTMNHVANSTLNPNASDYTPARNK